MLQLTTVLFLIALSTLAGVHILASKLFLYWHYVWLDLVMHFWGGACIALGLFAAADLRIPTAKQISESLFRVLVFAVFVMVAWEYFEVWAGILIEDNYTFDTTLDLITGFLGAIIGYYVAKKIRTL